MSSGILAIQGHRPTSYSLEQFLPSYDVLVHNNVFRLDQDVDRFEPSFSISDNVHTGAPVVLLFCGEDSPLRSILISYLTSLDVNIVSFSIEERLRTWLESHSSLNIASAVIQTSFRNRNIISRIHMHVNIQSILVYCRTEDIENLQRFSRIHPKIDAIFDDPTRILIKLVVDLTLVCEEIGDRQREEKKETEAQKNYQRALEFCAFVIRL